MTQQLWKHVRSQFRFEDLEVNLAGLSIAPHPKMVRQAIATHRRKLDARAFAYLSEELVAQETRVRAAASAYFDVAPDNIALTDGTTQGLTHLYSSVRVRPDQEILTTQHEFSGVLDCLDARAAREPWRSRPLRRSINLIPDPANVTTAALTSGIREALKPETRVLALSWVYSSTGVKMPMAAIADVVRAENARRKNPDDRILLCVDGVHGFGVENETFASLKCDFFMTGCHKWLFGPRGTGIWCGTNDAWLTVAPLFTASTGAKSGGPGWKNSPGGLHSYEHRWAVAEAFTFIQRRIGKAAVEARVRQLATYLKDGLRQIARVHIITPLSPEYSSGLVCVDVEEFRTGDDAKNGSVTRAVLKRLQDDGIVATSSSTDSARPDVSFVRFAVSIFNTEADIDRALATLAAL